MRYLCKVKPRVLNARRNCHGFLLLCGLSFRLIPHESASSLSEHEWRLHLLALELEVNLLDGRELSEGLFEQVNLGLD